MCVTPSLLAQAWAFAPSKSQLAGVQTSPMPLPKHAVRLLVFNTSFNLIAAAGSVSGTRAVQEDQGGFLCSQHCLPGQSPMGKRGMSITSCLSCTHATGNSCLHLHIAYMFLLQNQKHWWIHVNAVVSSNPAHTMSSYQGTNQWLCAGSLLAGTV